MANATRAASNANRDCDSTNLRCNRSVFRRVHLCINSLRYVFLGSGKTRARRNEDGQDNPVIGRTLESLVTFDNPLSVPINKDASSKSEKVGVLGDRRTAKANASAVSDQGRHQAIMPVQTLPSNHYVSFSFVFQRVPIFGSNHIRFHIESEYPIDSMVFDSTGFQNWKTGQNALLYAGAKNTTLHNVDFSVPHIGDWYLVINNSGIEATAIYYQLY